MSRCGTKTWGLADIHRAGARSVFLSYALATNPAHARGESGMAVIVRLSSFFLICIGAQIAWNGASALLSSAAFQIRGRYAPAADSSASSHHLGPGGSAAPARRDSWVLTCRSREAIFTRSASDWAFIFSITRPR